MIRLGLILILCALFGTTGLPAQGWIQWRGPSMNGSTRTTELPTEWSARTNIVWSIPLPGYSAATPAIFNTNIFLASLGSYNRMILMNVGMKRGDILWEEEIARYDNELAHATNTISVSSPVTDGKTVWVLFATGNMAEYDFEGSQLWKTNLLSDDPEFTKGSLCGASPTLYNKRLYVPVFTDQLWLVCLGADTGKTLWKYPRKKQSDNLQKICSTIIPYSGKNGTQLLLSASDALTAHDPENGDELWRYEWNTGAGQPLPTPLISSPIPAPEEGLVFAAMGDKLIAIRADDSSGNIQTDALVWAATDQNMPQVSTPLYYKNRLYMISEGKPIFTCRDAKTGNLIWAHECSIQESFASSPTGADDKIYCLSQQGTVVILGTGDQYQELAVIRMEEPVPYPSIAISNYRIFIRTNTKLHCIKQRKWIRFMDNVFLD